MLEPPFDMTQLAKQSKESRLTAKYDQFHYIDDILQHLIIEGMLVLDQTKVARDIFQRPCKLVKSD